MQYIPIYCIFILDFVLKSVIIDVVGCYLSCYGRLISRKLFGELICKVLFLIGLE